MLLSADQHSQVISPSGIDAKRLEMVGGKISVDDFPKTIVDTMVQKYSKINHRRHGDIGQANYAATKAAAIGLTMTITKEWGQFGARVNLIAFGSIHTGARVPLLFPLFPHFYTLSLSPLYPLHRTAPESDAHPVNVNAD
ncbi:3-oxoacyl-[acyl-carrier-protein] reductase FabG [Mycena venus]|uniref:3-oxoacyl-[acyl-carrier-protein] reductase FabG n=1 Tax=Mycena venus TaxID=2733690 RepID=A0A8H6Y5I7_9AGAR|nr:3-oxoacyl-[acyl-carrier-protein] reductase FabG [Mycena venus]